MDTHTLKVLEYPKVLEKLAAFTSNRMGREAALALTPSADPEIVRRRLQVTREARGILQRESGMPLGGIRDIREHVERAAIEYRLTPLELLDVAQTVAAARRLKSYLLKLSEEYPLLAEIARNMPVPPGIETCIEEALADNGDIRDTASPELERIRRQKRVVHSRLMDKLNSLLVNEKYRPYIQEPIITTREGRYCLPIKAENRSIFGGIVHDVSTSGATAFLEPGSCVELGNELKALALKEEQEIARILTRLTKRVGDAADDLRTLLGLLADLDLANAKALLAIEMQAAEPVLNRDGVLRLLEARHPLLTGKVVPIDVEVGDRFTTLLITGPNTGGKTVTLKTAGLLTLMTLAGMQIPASPNSQVALFEQVFADIGDEQDIQQSLSTFSAHMKNIVHIISTLGDNALVLLDEIGAGTDPAEGAALAKALLGALQRKGARVMATTHYGELKEYAYSQPGVENAAVEFDRETLRPTYHLLLGVPGSSHAFYIASRLGLPEEIIEAARAHLSSREQATAELLQQIEESRRKAFQMEREATEAKQAAESAREEYETRLRQIVDVQRNVRREAEEEARTILRRASEKVENILEGLRKRNRGSRKGSKARQELAALRREVADALQAPEPEPEEPMPAEGYTFRRGDCVRVLTLGTEGYLLEDPKEGYAVVQMGAMRATLPLGILRPARPRPEPTPRERSSAAEISMRKAIHISPELILRALRVEEAAPLLERYMDDAFTAGIRQARIIHGKGTGALRKFVWDYLKDHPVVESFRLGDESEGGEGATIVTLKE